MSRIRLYPDSEGSDYIRLFQLLHIKGSRQERSVSSSTIDVIYRDGEKDFLGLLFVSRLFLS